MVQPWWHHAEGHCYTQEAQVRSLAQPKQARHDGLWLANWESGAGRWRCSETVRSNSHLLLYLSFPLTHTHSHLKRKKREREREKVTCYAKEIRSHMATEVQIPGLFSLKKRWAHAQVAKIWRTGGLEEGDGPVSRLSGGCSFLPTTCTHTCSFINTCFKMKSLPLINPQLNINITQIKTWWVPTSCPLGWL